MRATRDLESDREFGRTRNISSLSLGLSSDSATLTTLVFVLEPWKLSRSMSEGSSLARSTSAYVSQISQRG